MATTINAWEGQLTRLSPPRWVQLSSATTQNYVSQTPSDAQNGSFVILSVPSGVTYTLSTGPTPNGPWTVEDSNYTVGFFASNPPSLKTNWQVINLALDFGLSTTGTDAIARIQSAVTAAPSTGWMLYMPPGIYPDAGAVPLSIQKNNIGLVGAGRRLSTIKPPTGITNAIIQVGDATHPYSNFLFQDFEIDQGGAAPAYNAGAHGIYLWNASYVDLLRVDALRTGDMGFRTDLGNTIRFYGCNAGQNGASGWMIAGGALIWLDKCLVDSVQFSAGVQITGADLIFLSKCHIFGGGRDGVQDNAAHSLGLFIDNCTIYSNAAGQAQNSYAAVRLSAASSGAVVRNSRLTNDNVNTASAGVILDAGATNATIEGNDLSMISAGPSGLIDNSGSSTNRIRNNKNYNPTGVVVVGVPASTVAVAAVAYDRDFYITTGAGATTIAIAQGPTITLQASVAGQFVALPAGKTLTPTYANPPTWVVEGK